MALSDPSYLPFLFLVVVCTSYLPERFKLSFVLFVSGSFYLALDPHWYVLVWVTTVGLFGGLAIARFPEGKGRLCVLFAAIIVAFAPLAFFKYVLTTSAVFNLLQAKGVPSAQLTLPIGLSFFSFTTIGYLIDVYLGTVPVERSAKRFALFTAFFPQVTQGPIGRATSILPQFSNVGRLEYESCVGGLRLILLGLFFKIVVADALAPLVNAVYATPTNHGGADQILATVYFAYQVYTDFAGYSLIAIGSAKILGVELQTNFAQPYLSQSVPEFWRRWHISLSSWFASYVFVPIQAQFRKLGTVSIVGALVVTFLLVGIWHGAGLKFAVFGIVHGTMVAASTLTLKSRTRYWKSIGIPASTLALVRTIITFGVVTSTLVLFRAGSFSDALYMYRTMASLKLGSITVPVLRPFIVIAAAVAIDLATYRKFNLKQWSATLRWSVYYAAALLICFSFIWNADENAARQFIYFKF